jgi:ribosomal protein L37E
MGSLGPPHLIALLLAIAVIAATCGFAASAARTRKRRAKGIFLLGVFCGFLAGLTVRRRHRDPKTLAVVALRAGVRPLIAGMRCGTRSFTARALASAASGVRLESRPPHWHDQLAQRFPRGMRHH